MSGDARLHLEACRRSQVTIRRVDARGARPGGRATRPRRGVIVDALFGTGLGRPVTGHLAARDRAGERARAGSRSRSTCRRGSTPTAACRSARACKRRSHRDLRVRQAGARRRAGVHLRRAAARRRHRHPRAAGARPRASRASCSTTKRWRRSPRAIRSATRAPTAICWCSPARPGKPARRCCADARRCARARGW